MKIHPFPSNVDRTLPTHFCNASPAGLGHYVNFGFLSPEIHAMLPNSKICGVAFTVKIAANDSTLVHKALDMVQAGDVLVIDRTGDPIYACVGEMVALAAKIRGVAGIVVDGPITDLVEISKIGIPVFATGTSVITTKILGLDGEINTPIHCGGDLIIGDENGVLALSPDIARSLIGVSEADALEEQQQKDLLSQGIALPDITGVNRLLESKKSALDLVKQLRKG